MLTEAAVTVLLPELERGVGDAAALVHHPSLGVVTEHDALERPALAAAAADPRGSVQLDALPAAEHVVDRVEGGGLAGAIVTEQEEVAAIAELDRLVDEVVEGEQADAPDRVGAAGTAHGAPPSSKSSATPSPAASVSSSWRSARPRAASASSRTSYWCSAGVHS